MADQFERAVVVDPQGFFVAALRWEIGTPAPKLNERATTGTKTPKLIMLRDPYAIENVETNAKWDFTPVREEDGTFVRAGTWLFPTEERWIVRQRRDLPDLWVLSGRKLIWPERPPRLPDGAKFVDVAPPDTGRSRKPIWDDTLQDWRTPKVVAVLDELGVVENFVVAYRDDDLPAGAAFAEIDAPVEGEAENGETLPMDVGDVCTVGPDGKAASVEIRRKPRYTRVPVRILEEVLTDRNLAGAFSSFVTSKGYSIAQVRNLGSISLNNKLLREFVISQGFTLKQAYNALQKAAEEIHQTEREAEEVLAEVER